jgi:hypothetical protein
MHEKVTAEQVEEWLRWRSGEWSRSQVMSFMVALSRIVRISGDMYLLELISVLVESDPGSRATMGRS